MRCVSLISSNPRVGPHRVVSPDWGGEERRTPTQEEKGVATNAFTKLRIGAVHTVGAGEEASGLEFRVTQWHPGQIRRPLTSALHLTECSSGLEV